MNRQEHLFVCLMEECAEISHSVSKILRFGLEECYLGYGNNRLEPLGMKKIRSEKFFYEVKPEVK